LLSPVFETAPFLGPARKQGAAATTASPAKITIEKFERGVPVERFEDRANWELMYFGKTRTRDAKI
jgi:hypothetical protein